MSATEVCVQVDCSCFYSVSRFCQPKDVSGFDIIGVHRIRADEKYSGYFNRAIVGSSWVWPEEAICQIIYPQICDKQNCTPDGRVVAVYKDCSVCPHKNKEICPKIQRQNARVPNEFADVEN